MNDLKEILFKIQRDLSPFIWDYLGNFIPKDKFPKDKTGKERCYCFNHKGGGLDKGKDMQFYPESGTFHCFSCGANYNIFSLANLYENKPLDGKAFYTDNVMYLADRYGINTHGLESYEIGTQQIKHTSLYNIMSEISSYITRNHNETFLAARKIKKETAILFGVGGIKSMEDFSNFLNKFKNEHLKELNILDEKGEINKRVFDLTKLIMTFKDVNGNPVGFSSREMVFNLGNAKKLLGKKYSYDEKVLSKITTNNELKGIIDLSRFDNKDIEFLNKCSITNKYNHTKTSEIFRKSEILFGYFENKSNFINYVPVKMLESPIDVLVGHSAGMTSLLALGGTAFTKEQFDFVEKNKHIDKVAFMLDNDSAGEVATIRIIEKIVSDIKAGEFVNKKYFVTKYKIGALKDLDENLNVYKGLDEFTEEKTLFEFYLNIKIKETKEDVFETVDEFVKIILQEEIPFRRVSMVKQLYNCLKEKAEENDADILITESQINQQLEFYVNKTDEQTRKIVRKEIRSLEKKLSSISSKEIDYHIESFKKNITTETSSLRTKKKTIFDTFESTLETDEQNKYTEEPKNFNCGFDMFENISWTGDEMITLLAKPHTGKTVFMSNITMNYLNNNKNTAVLYITTDDSTRKIVNNFIAITTNLNKSFVNEPKNNKESGLVSNNARKMEIQKIYQKGSKAISDLCKCKRLIVLQTTEGYNEFENIVTAVEEFNSDKDLKDFEKLLIIDSANKIRTKGIEDERLKIEFLSKTIKQDLAQRFQMKVMANFEVGKLDARTRVNKSKIKGSGAIEYDADMIISLSQPLIELSKNTSTYWIKAGEREPQPILIPTIEKSKPTGAKYQSFFYKMDGTTSKIIPIEKEDERNKILTSWINDNSRDNKDGYRHD